MQLEEPGYLVLVASYQERDHQHHERDHPIQHPWEEQEANLFQQVFQLRDRSLIVKLATSFPQ